MAADILRIMDLPHLDSPLATTTTGHSAGQADLRPDGEPAPSRLLPGLWLATAAALAVAPFLTQLRVQTVFQDTIPDDPDQHSIDGWGQGGGFMSGHSMRVGILFAAIALLLVLAAVATIAWRQARWPGWLGLSASAMAVTTGALQLAELEANRSLWEVDNSTVRTDVTFGPGAWLVLGLGVSAAVAVALSLRWSGRLAGRAPHNPTPGRPLADRGSFVLPGLWMAAAIGLVGAPFLTVYRVDDADNAVHLRIDGWGRAAGSLGIPCAILAVGLAGAAVAMMRRRSSTFPLRIGLIAGAGAVVVGGFLLLRLQSIFALEHPVLTASIGIGTWLVLAAGILAAGTAVLALVRQRAQEAH